MLYVSTRNRTDSFTAYRALQEDRAPDGGLFVPHRLPELHDDIPAMMEQGFGENVASILNIFFSVGLSGWDVDFIIGRHPVRLVTMNHRIVVGELWRNHASDYAYMVESLYHKLSGSNLKRPTDWAKVAIRIAVLFGIFSDLSRQGIPEADIAVPAGDFALPIAAWYARKMGLPVGRIICGCNENGAVWDLIHRAEFTTGSNVIHTDFPELDHACPVSIERLIFSVFGFGEVKRYLEVCEKRGSYQLDESEFRLLSDGLAAAVVSSKRIASVIKSIFRTNQYILDGYTAVAYSGLQDYRSRTGESRLTLLIADKSPVLALDSLTKILGISGEELKKQV